MNTRIFIVVFWKINRFTSSSKSLNKIVSRYRHELSKIQLIDEFTPYPCACCGYLTRIGERWNSWICPICGWQECNLQEKAPYYRGGPNRPSLLIARRNYFKIGAIEARRRGKKTRRDPLPTEIPTGGNPYESQYTHRLSSYLCPCCEFLTFESPPYNTLFACPVCLWTDELPRVKSRDSASMRPGSNSVTLEEAKCNFQELKASDPKYLPYVRNPKPEEMP